MFEEITLYRLKVFCEVVESQNFSLAAENLNVSQPAVSAHIRALEKETKITLLERGRVSRLTEAGQIVYNFARSTRQQTDEISQIIQELLHGNIGRINMGATSTMARYIMPTVLSKFKKENPGVELLLRGGNPKQICQMTLDREVDFGFVAGDDFTVGLIAKTIIKDELAIVVPPNHPLANKVTVKASKLSQYPFVLMANDFDHYNMIENLLNIHGVKIKEKLMELGDAEIIKEVLKSGMGVSALLGQCVVKELQAGQLKKVNLESGPIYQDLLLVWRPDKYLTPLQNKFKEFFEDTVRKIPIPTLS